MEDNITRPKTRKIVIELTDTGEHIQDVEVKMDTSYGDFGAVVSDLIIALAAYVAKEAVHISVLRKVAKAMAKIYMDVSVAHYGQRVGDRQRDEEMMEDVLMGMDIGSMLGKLKGLPGLPGGLGGGDLAELLAKAKDLDGGDMDAKCKACKKDCPLAGKGLEGADPDGPKPTCGPMPGLH